MIHCLGWMPRPSLPPHQRHTNEPVPPRASARPPLPPPAPVCHESIRTSIRLGEGIDRLLLYIRIKNPYILDCRIIGRRRGFGDVSSSSWSISEGGREGERSRLAADESLERMEGKRGKTKRGQNGWRGGERGREVVAIKSWTGPRQA